MRLFAVTLSFVALAFAAPAMAHQDPATRFPQDTGPYLFVADDEDILVLLAMGTREAGENTGSATSITFLSLEGTPVRADSIIRADCTAGARRTEPIYVWLDDGQEGRGTAIGSAPAIESTPWGPLDGPVRDLLCQDGAHDPARVHATVAAAAAVWRARR